MASISLSGIPDCIEVTQGARTVNIPYSVTYSFTPDEVLKLIGTQCSPTGIRIAVFAGGEAGVSGSDVHTLTLADAGTDTIPGTLTVTLPTSWMVGKHTISIYARLIFPRYNSDTHQCDETVVASDAKTVTIAYGVSCEEITPAPTPEQPVCKPTLCSSGDRVIRVPVEYEGQTIPMGVGKVSLKLCVSPSCVKPGQQFTVSATVTATGISGYNVTAINAKLSGPFGSRDLTFKNGETKTLTFTAPATENKYVLTLSGVVTLESPEAPPGVPTKVNGNFYINLPMWVTGEGGGAGSPITNWTVEVPPSVAPGQTFKVVVKAYASKPTNVRAVGTLFGKTVTKEGQAPGGSTPATLELVFTAPTTPGTYTGSVKLDAYY